jgi:Flp pilus assembly protein TadD
MEKVLPLMGTDVPKAAEMLAAIVTPQSSAVLDFTLANLRFQQGMLEEAAAGYRTAVTKFPRFQRGWKNLGLTSFRLGRMPDAIQAFTKMVELGGGDGLTYGLLAHAYSSEQQHTSAESAYRMAVLLQPDSLEWRMGLARSLVRQRKHAEAAAFVATADRGSSWPRRALADPGRRLPRHEGPLRAAENYRSSPGWALGRDAEHARRHLCRESSWTLRRGPTLRRSISTRPRAPSARFARRVLARGRPTRPAP